MSGLVKGQWYQSKETKRYFQCVCSDTGCIRMRPAGGTVRPVKELLLFNMLIPASLTPDFSNAKVGDECFSPILSHCQIADIDGNWEFYGDTKRFEVSEIYVKQKHTNNYMYYYPPRMGHHPSLYNSFAQFQAYWAEQALLMATQRIKS